MSNNRITYKASVSGIAPALTDDLLATYRSLKPAGGPIADAMETLLQCVEKWWELPESSGQDKQYYPLVGSEIVKLDKEIQDQLYDLIPWDHELKAMGQLFDTISSATDKPLRDAAYHLLWYVKEFNFDREPITQEVYDRLKPQ